MVRSLCKVMGREGGGERVKREKELVRDGGCGEEQSGAELNDWMVSR